MLIATSGCSATGRCNTFISSASAYQKPLKQLPITEENAAGKSILGIFTKENCL
ncbi:MAG: hypothetical protein R3C26_17400 [Calditrichia bacterium]